MSETIFNFISATFGIAFAAALLVMGAALWLTHYVTKKVTTIRCEHEAIKTKHKEHDEEVKAMSEDLSYCKTSLKTAERIEAHLDEIRRDLSYLKGNMDILKSGAAPLMSSHSPVSLTEAGEAVARELDGEGMIARNWDNILRQIDSAGNRSPYDIQQYCLESVSVEPERYLLTTDLDTVKDYAFSKGMPLQLYLRVLGLLIRDRYFAEHDIRLSEIDETQH